MGGLVVGGWDGWGGGGEGTVAAGRTREDGSVGWWGTGTVGFWVNGDGDGDGDVLGACGRAEVGGWLRVHLTVMC